MSFLPSEISEALALASSVPPKIARASAIMVGRAAICMMRLRRELAVARFEKMFTIPELVASAEKALFSERTWLDTSSVLANHQHIDLWDIIDLHSFQKTQACKQ